MILAQQIESKRKEREDLARQTQAYLEAGNKVDSCAIRIGKPEGKRTRQQVLDNMRKQAI